MGGPSRCPLPFRGGRTGDLPGVASPSVVKGLGICRLPFHGRSGPSLQIPSTALSLSLCVTGAGSSVWLGSHVSTAPRPLPDRSAFEVGGVPSGQPSQRARLQALGSGRLGSVRWLARRVRPPGSAPNSGSAGKALGSVSPPDAPGDCGVDRRGDIWSGSGSQRPAWPPARGSPPPPPRVGSGRSVGSHRPLSPQAGAALLQRQRPVLPGAEPVLRAAAPLPGVPQRHPPARGRAGLHGALPARRRVSHVHRGVPGHLQEPAAVPAPEVSGRGAGVGGAPVTRLLPRAWRRGGRFLGREGARGVGVRTEASSLLRRRLTSRALPLPHGRVLGSRTAECPPPPPPPSPAKRTRPDGAVVQMRSDP